MADAATAPNFGNCKGGTEERCRTGACGKGTWRKQPPQRHRITGFAAVVERGNGGKMPYRGCREGTWGKAVAATAPKRGFCCRCGKGERKEDAVQGPVERVHGESGLRNGTELRVLLPLWKGGMEGRCRTGAAEMVRKQPVNTVLI